MNEIMAGRAQTRVTAYELCRAIHADLQALIAVARSLGHKIKNESDYLSPGIVKELVFKIQNAASKQIGEKYDESTPTTEVLRSKTGLKSEIFEKLVKKEFGELRELIDDCLKGRQVRAGDEWLVSNDSTVLLEYARILESKVRGASPDSFRRRIVKRIFDDLAVYRERGGSFGAKRLRWRLLPPGRQPFDKLVQHFHNLSRKEPRIVFDIVRLHKAYSLNPDEVFVGTEEFEGYVVFYFAQAHTAILDCPVTGNAIYVFGENWRSLSHLTKSALLSRRKDSVRRIVHNGAWFSRLKSLLATRRLQAGVRQ